ncbi:MAG: hypothetical protein QM677_11165 [Microbacterium sp.]
MTRPSSSLILRRTLVWSAVVAAVIAVVASVVGWFVAGANGVFSALLGVGLSALFLGTTAAIILFAGRMEGPAKLHLYFGTIIVGWIVKLVIFVVALLLLRGQPWVEGRVFFFSVLANVIASLVIDMVVMARSRVPYVGDVELPTLPADDVDEQPRRA